MSFICISTSLQFFCAFNSSSYIWNFRAPRLTSLTPTLFCQRSPRTPSSPSWASCSSSPSSTSSLSSSTSSAAPWSRWSELFYKSKKHLSKIWKQGDGKGGSDPRERSKGGGGGGDGGGWTGSAQWQLRGRIFAKTSVKKNSIKETLRVTQAGNLHLSDRGKLVRPSSYHIKSIQFGNTRQNGLKPSKSDVLIIIMNQSFSMHTKYRSIPLFLFILDAVAWHLIAPKLFCRSSITC